MLPLAVRAADKRQFRAACCQKCSPLAFPGEVCFAVVQRVAIQMAGDMGVRWLWPGEGKQHKLVYLLLHFRIIAYSGVYIHLPDILDNREYLSFGRAEALNHVSIQSSSPRYLISVQAFACCLVFMAAAAN